MQVAARRQAVGVGRWLAAAGDGGAVHLLDARDVGEDVEPRARLEVGDQVWGMDFTADSRRLACSGHGETVSVFDLADAGARARVAPTGVTHSDLRFSPDGARLYLSSGYEDRAARVRVLDATARRERELA